MQFPKLFGLMFMGVCLAACGAETGSSGSGGTGGSTTGSGGGGAGGGCATAAECPAPTSECQVATCDSGACGTANVADGTAAKQQTAGDCNQKVCQAGSIATTADDTDVGDDGNDCTVDGCNAGSPTTAPEAVGTACSSNGGKVCNDSAACVVCNENADCTDAAKPLCDSSVCVPIDCKDNIKNGNETDVDCGGLCAPCDDLDACEIAADCKSGVCTGNVCQVPTCDDTVKNGLETDQDCGGGTCPKCGPDKGCETGEDCAGSQCTGMGGTCVPNCQDQALDNGESDIDCGGNKCSPCAVGKMCGAADTNCVSSAFCNAGTCETKKVQGTACGGDSQCTTGFCYDTVCCNIGCVGLCNSCNLPGSVGVCIAITAGEDPDDECPGADVCGGIAGCGKPTGAACASNDDCALSSCIDGYCCENPCFGTCKACSTAKTGQANGLCLPVAANTDPENECAGTLMCSGVNGCFPPLPNGSACPSSVECDSGSCVDGVCCNNPCNGLCKACNLPGTLGVCTNIPNGQDPANECAGAKFCTGSGTCN